MRTALLRLSRCFSWWRLVHLVHERRGDRCAEPLRVGPIRHHVGRCHANDPTSTTRVGLAHECGWRPDRELPAFERDGTGVPRHARSPLRGKRPTARYVPIPRIELPHRVRAAQGDGGGQQIRTRRGTRELLEIHEVHRRDPGLALDGSVSGRSVRYARHRARLAQRHNER